MPWRPHLVGAGAAELIRAQHGATEATGDRSMRPLTSSSVNARVKGLMAIQSMVSLAVLVLVISRVINIQPS